MKPTTALRKICALKRKIWGIQGGQGAGKTFSILLILINHAKTQRRKKIYVVSAELSKMRDTVIKDFLEIIDLLGIQVELTGMTSGPPKATFPNGSFIRFIGLDKEDVGKGMRSDVVFVNEANKVNFETYRELTSRAKKVIVDFNPNKKFWFHTEIMTREDCDFLKLTFVDNEFLSAEERYEILLYKIKGYQLDVDGNFSLTNKGERIIINQYWANMWRVYGEGEVGQVEGRIYTWNAIDYSEYLAIDKKCYIGNDWGKVDPWAIVEVKYHDGNLYVHELNYASENDIERDMSPEKLRAIRGAEINIGEGEKSDGLVDYMYKQKLKVPYDMMISCDSNRKYKIKTLRHSGYDYAVSVGRKPTLIERVGILSSLNIYYTSCSKNIEMEQESYCYDKDKFGKQLEEPVDQDNHAIDAITYIVKKMFDEGIIRSI